jgi:manganese/iron transport system substrate-binding protein
MRFRVSGFPGRMLRKRQKNRGATSSYRLIKNMLTFSTKKSFSKLGMGCVSILLASSLVACSQSQSAEEKPTPKPKPVTEKLQVVATTSVLCDLAKIIADNTIDLKCLIPKDRDSFSYEPSAADKEALDMANVVLYSGHGLEDKLIPVIKASNADRKIPVAEIAVTNPEKISVPGVERKDLKPNPFVWHNAYKALEMAKVIHQKLGDMAPKNAETYEQRYEDYDKVTTALHEWVKLQIAGIPAKNRQLVSSRSSLNYYSNPYNIAVEGSVYDYNTVKAPSTERIAKVVKRIKDLKIKAVFNEANVDGTAIGKVASDAKVPVIKGELFIDGLGGTDSHQKMMEHNTKMIVEGLGGKYTAFQPPKVERKGDKKKDK